MNLHEIEEMEFATGPRLWDADPDVCCAAFQLGACAHTESYIDDQHDAEELLAEIERQTDAAVCSCAYSDRRHWVTVTNCDSGHSHLRRDADGSLVR